MTKRIALIVGIDQYNCEEIVGLKGAIRDATKFNAYLEYGLPEGERFETIFLSNATHELVINALDGIRKKLKNEEDVVFVLYFSGHGKRFHDGASQLLLCRDATRTTLLGRTTAGAITPEELAYYKDEIPGHKFFCFDSCRSQLDRAHGDDLDENGTSLFRDVVCRRSKAAQAKFYCHWSLSSCADRERASDDGAFMNAMLDTMKTSVAAHGRILLDDSFVKAIADRIHLSNPDSYQHPVGGGNSFCLCGKELGPDDFKLYAEQLAQDAERKLAVEQGVSAKSKMDEAKTLADQGRYTDAVEKIDEALKLFSDGEFRDLLTLTRATYVQAANERAAKALEEERARQEAQKKARELSARRVLREADKAVGGTEERVFSRRRFLYWGGAGALVAVGGYWGVRRSTPDPSFFDANAGELKTVTVNGVEYRFRWCPAGSFKMGSNNYDDEKPVHKVTLTKGFWLQETETTQEQWKSIMGSNPSCFKGDNLRYFKGDNFPVESVSWNDVAGIGGFISQLNAKASGFCFRLPTEAEWEWASRGGENYKYSGSDDLRKVGWYDDNSGDKTHAVGTKKANGWGLFDMSGNVWEWCQDWYGDYPNGTATDPQGPSSGSGRVRRGGSWYHNDYYCRCSDRSCSSPGYSNSHLGVRLLLESDD